MKCPQVNLTDVLAQEHHLIQRGLVVLGRMASHLRAGGEVHPEVVEACLRFLREFADQGHHDKEERILFPWLESHGLSHESGPLAVLRDEHEHVRDHVRRMSVEARRLGTDPRSVRTFVAHANQLVLFFWRHLLKENEVLFPMAERTAGGTAVLIHPPDGGDRSLLVEYSTLVEHLEKVASAWPPADPAWPVGS